MTINRKNSIKKNIVIAVITIIFFLVIYFYVWRDFYEKDEINIGSPSKINYNELSNYLVENKDAVFYVSISNDNAIEFFEKKLKNFIDDYSLNNSILYLDITSELKDKKLYKEINDRYSVNVPYVIIFDNGNIKSIFSIRENNFDMELLKEYFINEGVIDD